MTPPWLARRLLLAASVVTVWAGAVAGTLAVAHWTKLGVVVVRLSHRHGIHAGDLAAAVLFSSLALVASVQLRQRLLVAPARRLGRAGR